MPQAHIIANNIRNLFIEQGGLQHEVPHAELLEWLQAHGEVHIQAAEKIYNISEIGTASFQVVLQQLPFRPQKRLTPNPFLTDIFLGRETELEAIRQQLLSGTQPILLVNGDGGMGKTTLASQYYHTYQSEYKHTAWLSGEGGIANALVQLEYSLTGKIEPNLTAEERIGLVLTAMANLEKPCLLIIDNANELTDLRENYLHLCTCSNFHLLLTTRITAFEQAPPYTVKALSEEDAIQLFKAYYPGHQDTENDLLMKVLGAIGYNTLVIELFAKNLHYHNELEIEYSLEQLLADINRSLLDLSRSHVISTSYQAGDGALRSAKAEEIILAMYSISSLSEQERKLISVFSVLPAENIEWAMLKTLLPDEHLKDTVLLLAQKGWISRNKESNAFKISPVVQVVVRKSNEKLYEDCKGLMDVLNEKLDYQPGINHPLNSSYEEAAHYARYAGVVVEAFEVAYVKIDILCERIGSFFTAMGDLVQALRWFERGTGISEGLLKADPDNPDRKNGLAISYAKLGETHTDLGNLDKALGFFETYNQLEQELYDAYPSNVEFKNLLAISYQLLGITHSTLGNLDKALRYFEQYNQLEQELSTANPNNVEFKNGLAVSYEKLGNVHTALDNLDKALGFFEERSRLAAE
ncbi:MAG: hypothetical protein EAZ89_11925, partial [Bacteroidetes bacterium]